MNKKRAIHRRAALKTLGASTIILLQQGPKGVFALGSRHSLVPAQDGDEPWRPRFFTSHENKTVEILTERIIPKTDTPGAMAAKVNQYIDYDLSQATALIQKTFRKGLEWVDRRSQQLFGGKFIEVDTERQTALLTALSSPENQSAEDERGVDFFNDIKERTIFGYYSSAAGMLEELGYAGNTFLSEFEGCTHPEHLNWQPSSGRARS